MKHCGKCGANLSKEDDFCPKCGMRVKMEVRESKSVFKQHTWLFLGVAVGVVLILAVIIVDNNTQKRAELEQQLAQITAEKTFCDNLQLKIMRGASGLGPYKFAGVNFCVYSNQGGWAKLKTTFKDGKILQDDITLSADACMTQGLSTAIVEGEWKENIEYDDISSIEVTSSRCPTVTDVVIDLNRLKPED
ncbi:zinc ribbon domain-containing protein [Candidatus Woesearchaeota archaeon]|nr:zinc ribbon domain-containing protein [Candidatus Woesearchaeota archaeon]